MSWGFHSSRTWFLQSLKVCGKLGCVSNASSMEHYWSRGPSQRKREPFPKYVGLGVVLAALHLERMNIIFFALCNKDASGLLCWRNGTFLPWCSLPSPVSNVKFWGLHQPIHFWCKKFGRTKTPLPFRNLADGSLWQQLLAMWFKTSCHYNWCVFILSTSWSLIRIKIAIGISCQSNSFIRRAEHWQYFDWTLPSAILGQGDCFKLYSLVSFDFHAHHICKYIQIVHHAVTFFPP